MGLKKIWESDSHVMYEKDSTDGWWILLVVIGLVALLYVVGLFILFFPIVMPLLSFFSEASNRIWHGVLSLLGSIYLVFDYYKGWLTDELIYGNNDSEALFGLLENGLFDGLIAEYFDYFLIADGVGVILSIIVIIHSIKSNN